MSFHEGSKWQERLEDAKANASKNFCNKDVNKLNLDGISDEAIKEQFIEEKNKKTHPDSGKCFWCIVIYYQGMLMYYVGYYGTYNPSQELQPFVTTDFVKALKLHSKEEAERILAEMKLTGYKVEEHGYF